MDQKNCEINHQKYSSNGLGIRGRTSPVHPSSWIFYSSPDISTTFLLRFVAPHFACAPSQNSSPALWRNGARGVKFLKYPGWPIDSSQPDFTDTGVIQPVAGGYLYAKGGNRIMTGNGVTPETLVIAGFLVNDNPRGLGR